MPDGNGGTPFRLRTPRAGPTGWPADVVPNEIILAVHINRLRDAMAIWPGDVNGGGHKLSNVVLEAVTGVLTDPTTTAGDILVRGAAGIERLPVGAAGQALMVDLALPAKVKWAAPPGAVTSFNTRVGAVVPASGDYNAAQVTNAVSTLGSYGDPTWITSLAWTKITGTPSSFTPAAHTHAAADVTSGVFARARLGGGVADATVYLRGDGVWAAPPGGTGAISSVFGRTGAIVATSGDYTVSQVTGALADPMLARGDIITRTTTAVARIPVGADGQVLQADSTQAGGVKWGAVSGTWIDPTSVKGDLLVRDSTAITRLAVGADGLILMADAAQPTGVKWAAAPGGAGAVASVFGRTGAVIANNGDYNASQVLNAVDATIGYANPTWITSLSFTKLTGVPLFLEDPTTAKGDLIVRAASAIINLPAGADGMILTADAAQTAGVKWSPAAAGVQTPWTSDIDAAGFDLRNVGQMGIGTSLSPNRLSVVEISQPSTDAGAGGGAFSISTPTGATTDDKLLVGVHVGDYAWIQAIKPGTATRNLALNPGGSNVGIGTNAPLARLDAVVEEKAYDASVGGQSSVRFAIGAGINDHALMFGVHSAGYSWIQAVQPGVTARNLLLNPSGGNVGIGTSLPGAKMHVHTDAAPTGTVGGTLILSRYPADGSSHGGAIFSIASTVSPNPDMLAFTVSTSGGFTSLANIKMVITALGYVGIGTSSPTSKLSVIGLPTSSAGLSAGDIWIDTAAGRVLKIV